MAERCFLKLSQVFYTVCFFGGGGNGIVGMCLVAIFFVAVCFVGMCLVGIRFVSMCLVGIRFVDVCVICTCFVGSAAGFQVAT